MENLWAPWRMEYVSKKKEKGCIFYKRQQRPAGKSIIYKGKTCFVILNKYPYNQGHLMVAPFRHTAAIAKLSAAERNEFIYVVGRTVELLRKVLKADGFNLGVNLGKVAGAGMPGHLHFHIVPRWEGDSNFMPIIGKTKVVSEALAKTYRKLAGEAAGFYPPQSRKKVKSE